MTAFMDIQFQGDFSQTYRMIHYLQTVLSPVGFATFLQLHVGPYLQTRAETRFRDEGDDAVGQWAPLQPATVEIRDRMQVGGDHPINVRTGELEDWITGGNWKINQTALGVTLVFPGAEPRDPGLRQKMETAQVGRATPPTVARPVLGMNEQDLAYVITTMAFWIGEGAKLL
jgi:hypothetical protein